jgi:DNA repair exonuclease SbcCD nuclease subunit
MRIAVFADLHIGKIDNIDRIRKEYSHYIRDALDRNLDLLVFAGDLFDTKLTANSKFIGLVLSLIEDLYALSLNYPKLKIRFIHGTESHDVHQYQILSPYTYRKDCDMKIISSVYEEEICNETVLYIPEEVIKNKKEYYKDTLYSKQYDYIFGHGTISTIMPHVGDNADSMAPAIFTPEELSEHTNKLCCFGHYHIGSFPCDDKVGYVGSLTTLQHGEGNDKGYVFIDDDKLTFVRNTMCPVYYKQDHTLSEDVDIASVVANIKEKIKTSDREAFVKCDFKISRKDPEYEIKVTMIRDGFRDNPNMRYTIIPIIEGNEEKVNEMKNQYSYLFNDALSVEDKLKEHISQVFGENVDPKYIKELL